MFDNINTQIFNGLKSFQAFEFFFWIFIGVDHGGGYLQAVKKIPKERKYFGGSNYLMIMANLKTEAEKIKEILFEIANK